MDAAFEQKRRALAEAREVYALYGRAEALAAFEFAGEHTFVEAGRMAAYAWLRRWLHSLGGGRPPVHLPKDRRDV